MEQRLQKQLTQREVGALLNVSHSWVGKVEQGERRLDIIEYVRLCNALGIDPHEGLSFVLNYMQTS